jgi:hypothetical protein
MSIDKQGKGTGEGAVERNTVRPTENKQTSSVKEQVERTNKQVQDVMKKK